jgi:hypothetical protein
LSNRPIREEVESGGEELGFAVQKAGENASSAEN